LPQILFENFAIVTDTDSFSLFLALKEFSLICFSEEISIHQLRRLTQTCSNIFQLLYKIDPNYKIFPKLHHLIHYRDQIQKFGPLINYSTLPFERKHQQFKRWSRNLFNFTNPAKSLASRHQHKFILSFEQKLYTESKFDYQNLLCPINDLMTETLPESKQVIPALKRPFKLNKGIVL
jgi:hypothetical protein